MFTFKQNYIKYNLSTMKWLQQILFNMLYLPHKEISGVDYYSTFTCLEDENLPINACNNLQTVI